MTQARPLSLTAETQRTAKSFSRGGINLWSWALKNLGRGVTQVTNRPGVGGESVATGLANSLTGHRTVAGNPRQGKKESRVLKRGGNGYPSTPSF